MYKILVLTFIMISATAKDCSQVEINKDIKDKLPVDKSFSCKISSPSETIFAIKYKNFCERFEGSKSKDCIVIRNCQKSPEVSTPIIIEKSYLNGLCEDRPYQVFGLKDSTSKTKSKAFIKCSKSKYEIILIASNGQTKTCEIKK